MLINGTEVREFCFRIYAVKSFFFKRIKRELRKNLGNFFTYVPYLSSTFRALIDLRTVQFKYGTFRAYHSIKSTLVRYPCNFFFFFFAVRYVSTVR